MNGGQNEIILIAQRRPGQIAGRHRRIEYDLRRKLGARGKGGRQLHDMLDVGLARLVIFVVLFEQGTVKRRDSLQLNRQSELFVAKNAFEQFDQAADMPVCG